MRRLTTVLLVLSCFSCAGCNVDKLLGLGGGKKSVTVVVDPKTQSVVVAMTQQFTATVTGSSNTAVAWSVSGTNCSTTQDCGSISAAGLYTAPNTVPNPALVAVTATSKANSADFGTAAVTIVAATDPASMLRGTYTFLLSGSDAEGPLSIVGTFEADGSGLLLNGELRLCRSESHCSDQAFAGATASTNANNGIFTADIFPASTFTFSPAPNNVFKLDVTGSHNLRASGILSPNSTSADN